MSKNYIETKTVLNTVRRHSTSKIKDGYYCAYDREITPLAEEDVSVFMAQNDGTVVVDLTGGSLQSKLLAGATVRLSGFQRTSFQDMLFSRFGQLQSYELRALVDNALPGVAMLEGGKKYVFSLKETPGFSLSTTDGTTIILSENDPYNLDIEVPKRTYHDNSGLIRHIVETAQTMNLGVEGDIWSGGWLESQKKKISKVYDETVRVDLEKNASKELLTLVAETTHEAAVTGEVETYSLLGRMFSGTTNGSLDSGLLLNLGFDTKEQEEIRYLLTAGIDLWRKYVETGEVNGVDEYKEKLFERFNRAPNKRDWLIGYFVSNNLYPRSTHVEESIEHLFYSVMVMAGYTKDKVNNSEVVPIDESSFAVEGELEGVQSDMAIAFGRDINELAPILIERLDENNSRVTITNGRNTWNELEGAKVKPWFRSVNSPFDDKTWLNPTKDLINEATSTITGDSVVYRKMVVGQSLWLEPKDMVPGYFFIKNGKRQVTVTKVDNQISIIKDGEVIDSWKAKNKK